MKVIIEDVKNSIKGLEDKMRKCFRKQNRKKKTENRIRMVRKLESKTWRSKFKPNNFTTIKLKEIIKEVIQENFLELRNMSFQIESAQHNGSNKTHYSAH